MPVAYKICIRQQNNEGWSDQGNYLANSEIFALDKYFLDYPDDKIFLKLSDIKIQKFHCAQTTYDSGETI